MDARPIGAELIARLAAADRRSTSVSRWSDHAARVLFGSDVAGHEEGTTVRVALTADRLRCFARHRALFTSISFVRGTANLASAESASWVAAMVRNGAGRSFHLHAHAALDESPDPQALSEARAKVVSDLFVHAARQRVPVVVHAHGARYSATLDDGPDVARVARVVVGLDAEPSDTSEIYELPIDPALGDWLAGAVASLDPPPPFVAVGLHAPRACFEIPVHACPNLYDRAPWSELAASLLRIALGRCEAPMAY